ncbi:autotransporter outer membrane beta-barrel domain-containing protein [Pseudomonas sp. 6D_7.1_Bac1]|uniref:autotransporter outer membrane beta-barrel domain-containing protein n=1 Tax=Pseudomonas sp. 6D_7.1_Bac1 TaxID=2971615 RepID=UPI0021C8D5CA|nr:autotransporter outer membrane beta-barrel domain-containing protein [Pseudomonas sp. 6D_7.1_Bac1]MCU1748826.1 autotransporter outer membrane beta-barrel domain-containing protein [Pseudomonas sp. 6D_7.1_Bac1]
MKFRKTLIALSIVTISMPALAASTGSITPDAKVWTQYSHVELAQFRKHKFELDQHIKKLNKDIGNSLLGSLQAKELLRAKALTEVQRNNIVDKIRFLENAKREHAELKQDIQIPVAPVVPVVSLDPVAAVDLVVPAEPVTDNINSELSQFLAENKGTNIGAAVRALAHVAETNDEVADAFGLQLEGKTSAEMTAIAKELLPEVNGAAALAAMSVQKLTSGAIGARSSGLRRGLSSGEGMGGTGVWVQALGSKADQNQRAGIAGFTADSRGIAVGVDGKLGEEVTLGLAFSSVNTDVKSENGNSTHVSGQALTLYGGYEQDAFFADGSMTLGRNSNDSKRHVVGSLAKGSYDSDLFGLNVMAGYGFDLAPGLTLEPRVAGRYSRVALKGFTERGAPLALNTGGQNVEALELGTGVRLLGSFALGRGTLEPQVTAMAYHDFAADTASVNSTYVVGGPSFVTTGAQQARNSYEVGMGVGYRLGAVNLGLSYDYQARQDFKADTVQAKVRYDF